MKAIRFKLQPTEQQIAAFDALRCELSKAWNVAHTVAMTNRSVEWWQWAKKQAIKQGINFEGATPTLIKFGKRHAYVGVYCEIIRDGGWWEADKQAEPIRYRGKKAKPGCKDIYWQDGVAYEALYKHPHTKWHPPKPGKQPYSVANQAFQYVRVPTIAGGGKEIKSLKQLDNAQMLREFGVDMPPGTSDYLGGMLKQFEESYKAWCDTKRTNAHKPRYRHLDRPEQWVRSLYNAQTKPSKQYGCTAANLEFSADAVDLKSVFGKVPLYKGEFDRIPEGMIPRSYIFTQDASGYYLSVTFATEAEVALVKAKAQRPPKGCDDAEKSKFNDRKKQDVADYQSIVDAERYNPGNGKTLGIDPGVVRQITAHDGRKTFHIKLSRDRHAANQKLTNRTDRLKGKLSRIKSTNNQRYGLEPDHKRSAGLLRVDGKEVELRNEAKLQRRIARLQLLRANRRKAYQHRVSVRLFDAGYSEIKFEKTQVSNMNRSAKPKLTKRGTYAKNHAAAKSGLNRSLADTAMAAQAEKIKTRFTTASRRFTEVPAANTSQLCHRCGEKGDRATQDLFCCLNDRCRLFNQPQNADDNASKNIFLN